MGTAALYRVCSTGLRYLGFTRAFIYSNRSVCSVCFCSLLPRLTLLCPPPLTTKVLTKWTESLLADSNIVFIEGEDAKYIDVESWTPDFEKYDLLASSTTSVAKQDQETGANDSDQDALQHYGTDAKNPDEDDLVEFNSNEDDFVELTPFPEIDEANAIDPMTLKWPDSPGPSQ